VYSDGAVLPPEVRDLVDRDRILGAAHHAADGIADPALLRRRLEAEAVAQGAIFEHGVAAVDLVSNGAGWAVRTVGGADDTLHTDHVVLAGGIWAPTLDRLAGLDLPLFPVSHPYVTPDNLPFLGPHPRDDGLWVAEAIWVTHAGGAARALARAILAEEPAPSELAVDRFDGRAPHELRAAALRLYRDIYANDAAASG
jgi:glycine/D-amino acid oxidase-like deaminating enzyme